MLVLPGETIPVDVSILDCLQRPALKKQMFSYLSNLNVLVNL